MSGGQSGSQAPYSLHLDNETAQAMVTNGGTLLFLGVPPGTVVGVDHQAFSAGPKFMGIKMIPPGTHFISCRPISNQSADIAPSTSYFIPIKPKQVVVRKWDIEKEVLVPLPDEDEADRYIAGVQRFDFDANLAPYDLMGHRRWSELSCFISPSLSAALSPASGGGISIMDEGEDIDLLDPKTDAERALVQQLQEGRAAQAASGSEAGEGAAAAAAPGVDAPVADSMSVDAQVGGGAGGSCSEAAPMSVDEVPLDRPPNAPATQEKASSTGAAVQGHRASSTGAAAAATAKARESNRDRCRYTELPRLIKQQGISASELTALNMDKSEVLKKILKKSYSGSMDGILGELQFAFISFVFGQSLDGFSQWKALLALLLGCVDAPLHTHRSGFTQLLRVLRNQLAATLGAPVSGPPSASATGQQQGTDGAAAPFGVPLVEELLPDSFLRRNFADFFSMMQENSADVASSMEKEAQSLKQLLRSSLGWEFDMQLLCDGSEDDEDMPVIVDLDESYAL